MITYWNTDPQVQELKVSAVNTTMNLLSASFDYMKHVHWRMQTASPKEILTYSIQAFMLFYAFVIAWHLSSGDDSNKKQQKKPQKAVSFKPFDSTTYEKTTPSYPMTRSRVAVIRSQQQGQRRQRIQQPIRNNYK